jgi:hypothetical protein
MFYVRVDYWFPCSQARGTIGSVTPQTATHFHAYSRYYGINYAVVEAIANS